VCCELRFTVSERITLLIVLSIAAAPWGRVVHIYGLGRPMSWVGSGRSGWVEEIGPTEWTTLPWGVVCGVRAYPGERDGLTLQCRN